MPKITLGITGLHEILGRDYGIEEPYWGPSAIGQSYLHDLSHTLFRRTQRESSSKPLKNSIVKRILSI